MSVSCLVALLLFAPGANARQDGRPGGRSLQAVITPQGTKAKANANAEMETIAAEASAADPTKVTAATTVGGAANIEATAKSITQAGLTGRSEPAVLLQEGHTAFLADKKVWMAGELGSQPLQEMLGNSAEAIVVMGQLLLKDRTATHVMERRITEAVSVFEKQGRKYPVIVSGGDPHDIGVTEASVMQTMLVTQGVPSELILTEDKSANTVQNAINVLKMLGPRCQKLHLITSDFHMPRCSYVYEAVLNAMRRKNIGLVLHPVSGGCPSVDVSEKPAQGHNSTQADDSDGSHMTVNTMTLLQRLQLEQHFLANEEEYLKKDSRDTGVNVQPLKGGLKQARARVAGMIKKEEQDQATNVPNLAEKSKAKPCMTNRMWLMLLIHIALGISAQ